MKIHNLYSRWVLSTTEDFIRRYTNEKKIKSNSTICSEYRQYIVWDNSIVMEKKGKSFSFVFNEEFYETITFYYV